MISPENGVLCSFCFSFLKKRKTERTKEREKKYFSKRKDIIMGNIKIIGLGAGDFSLLTLETWEIIQKARNLILRTAVHPTAEELKRRGVQFSSYDEFYDTATDFAALYEKIAEDLTARAQKATEDIVYAVPGSPLVAEKTVLLLEEKAKAAGIGAKIFPGMSFLEVLYARLKTDPVDGLMIIDALDAATKINEATCAAVSLVLTQVYDKRVASDTKLTLMNFLPDDYGVIYLHNLSLPDERICQIPRTQFL